MNTRNFTGFRSKFSMDAIERLAASVQPLVFETNLTEFPYSTSGTAFLIGFNEVEFDEANLALPSYGGFREALIN